MKILYVLGRGRSGSTILANVLGEVPGFFSAGEVRVLWELLASREPHCSCGSPLAECEIWGPVLSRLSDVDPHQVLRAQASVLSERRTLRLLRSARRQSWPELDRYAAVMERLYRAVVEVTGCRVVVDSSKRPAYAGVVRHLAGADPYFLHLVRDPRASAYSWGARRHEAATGGQVRQRSAIDATLRWDVLNLGAAAVLRAAGGRRLRYEDFAARPRTVVEQLVGFVSEQPDELPFLDERSVRLGVNHALGGNPSRLKTGVVELRDSQQWRHEQSARDRWTATALALPFLAWYRYPLRPLTRRHRRATG